WKGDEGDGKAAHHQHSENAEIKQPAEAPLDVEPQCNEREGKGLDQQAQRKGRAHEQPHPHDERDKRSEKADIAQGHDEEAPLKMPVGLTSSTTTRMMKATVSLYSDCTRARF